MLKESSSSNGIRCMVGNAKIDKKDDPNQTFCQVFVGENKRRTLRIIKKNVNFYLGQPQSFKFFFGWKRFLNASTDWLKVIHFALFNGKKGPQLDSDPFFDSNRLLNKQFLSRHFRAASIIFLSLSSYHHLRTSVKLKHFEPRFFYDVPWWCKHARELDRFTRSGHNKNYHGTTTWTWTFWRYDSRLPKRYLVDLVVSTLPCCLAKNSVLVKLFEKRRSRFVFCSWTFLKLWKRLFRITALVFLQPHPYRIFQDLLAVLWYGSLTIFTIVISEQLPNVSSLFPWNCDTEHLPTYVLTYVGPFQYTLPSSSALHTLSLHTAIFQQHFCFKLHWWHLENVKGYLRQLSVYAQLVS